LQDEGDGRIRWALAFGEFAAEPDAQERLMVLEVEDDDGDFAVGVEGGGGDEVVTGGSRNDAFGAGTDEAGELAQNVVRGVVGDFAGGGVGVDNGASVDAGDAAGVTRAIVLVENEVPDIPALGPVVEVGDDALGEAQGGGPGAPDAAFGVEEMFVGEGIVDDTNVIEVVRCTSERPCPKCTSRRPCHRSKAAPARRSDRDCGPRS